MREVRTSAPSRSSSPSPSLVSTGFIPQGIALGDAVEGGLAQETQVPASSAPVGAINGVTTENARLLALNNVDPGQILLSSNFVAALPDLSPDLGARRQDRHVVHDR